MTEPKKKPGSKRAQSGDRHTQPRVAFHLPTELLAALEAYLDETKPAPSGSAVMRLALEEFLAQRGHWPLKSSTK